MRLRLGCVILLVALCSCHALPSEQGELPIQLWEKGQRALKDGKPQEAIQFYKQSLSGDKQLMRNHLGLAAAYLEKGDDSTACVHLSTYVSAHPENLEARLQFAELLVQQRRYLESRGELDRLVADAQERAGDCLREMIEAHSLLAELAEIAQDEYEERLHRGIGFYLLALRQEKLGEGEGGLTTQGLLCKAAGELSTAREVRPREPRPVWYLYRVWRQLGQQQPAREALEDALAAAPFGHLNRPEHRSLLLAERASGLHGLTHRRR